MSADHLARLPVAFGNVIARLCRERNVAAQEVVTSKVTLEDFFRIATVLGESPVILLMEVITAWRAEPTDRGLYRSRPSDLARLYRLGYFHDPGDFRELSPAYSSLDHATADARKFNPVRASKGSPPIDTLTIYVRVGHIWVDAQPETP
jgi:hypothetical protein